HLVALALQAGGPRRREPPGFCDRVELSTERVCGLSWICTVSPRRFPIDSARETDGMERLLARNQEWHRQQARQPFREKVRILFELHCQELPLLAHQRPFIGAGAFALLPIQIAIVGTATDPTASRGRSPGPP